MYGVEELQNFKFDELSPQQLNGVVAISIAIGVLYCFLGYRTLKFLIAFTGFVAAGMTAAVLTGLATNGHPYWMAGSGLFGGVCGAFAVIFIYKLGVFMLGGLGGALALQNILADRPEAWAPFAVIAGGIAAGALALVIEPPVLMLATAALGAWAIISGFAYFFFDTDWINESPNFLQGHEDRAYFVLAWAVLALAGAMAQFATRKKNGK